MGKNWDTLYKNNTACDYADYYINFSVFQQTGNNWYINDNFGLNFSTDNCKNWKRLDLQLTKNQIDLILPINKIVFIYQINSAFFIILTRV